MVIFQCYLEYFFLASTKYPFHLEVSIDHLAIWQFLDLKKKLFWNVYLRVFTSLPSITPPLQRPAPVFLSLKLSNMEVGNKWNYLMGDAPRGFKNSLFILKKKRQGRIHGPTAITQETSCAVHTLLSQVLRLLPSWPASLKWKGGLIPKGLWGKSLALLDVSSSSFPFFYLLPHCLHIYFL